MYEYIYTCNIYIYVYLYIYIHTYVSMNICIRVNIYVYTCMHKDIIAGFVVDPESTLHITNVRYVVGCSVLQCVAVCYSVLQCNLPCQTCTHFFDGIRKYVYV